MIKTCKWIKPMAAGLLFVSFAAPVLPSHAHAQDDTSVLRIAGFSDITARFMPGSQDSLSHDTQEGLVRVNPNDPMGGVVPGLAASWDVSQDGTIYTFHLRDANWSNGSPITADDFVYEWNKIKSQSPLMANTLEIQSMASVDQKTLQVTFSHSGDYLIRIFGNDMLIPVKQSFAVANGGNFGLTPAATLYSGPFVVKEVASDHLTLQKNPNYWDAQNVSLDKIVFYLGLSPKDMARLYEQGDLDMVSLAFAYQPFFSSQERKVYEEADTDFLLFASNAGPTANVHIRNALQMAYQNLYPSSATFDFVPRGIAGAQTQFQSEYPKLNSYSLQQAKAELQKGLQELGLTQLPPIEVEASNAASYQYLKTMWNNALGIQVNVQSYSSSDIRSHLLSGQAQIGVLAWMADFNDPSDFLNLFHSKTGYTQDIWNNPQYDSLLDAANQAPDRATRMQKLEQADIFLNQQAVLIPMFQGEFGFIVHPNVTVSVTGWQRSLELRLFSKNPAPVKDPSVFSDSDAIPGYSRDSIARLLNMGVVNGKGGYFDPGGTVTREEFVKMLIKGLGLSYSNIKLPFDDINRTMWSYPYIQTAVSQGIVHGFNENGRQWFDPTAPITRAQMATLLKNALQLPDATPADGFSDLDGNWAAADILSVKAAGLIYGDQGAFHPDAPASRADAAVVIDRALNKLPLPNLPQP